MNRRGGDIPVHPVDVVPSDVSYVEHSLPVAGPVPLR